MRLRELGLVEYSSAWQAMQRFTEARASGDADELWLVEHPPVYTLGLGARPEHLLDPGTVPVVRCDRGGQVTYHGPGQAIVYTLLDLRALGWGVKRLVAALEQCTIAVLAQAGIEAERRRGAPGVYVGGCKIAALGLRVRRGCSYHGVALNVDLDLAPFAGINPCGYPGLAVTRIADLGASGSARDWGLRLAGAIAAEIAGEAAAPLPAA